MSGPPSSQKPALFRELLDAHGDLCWLCKRPIDLAHQHPNPLRPTFDHVVPQSRGGTWDFWNLRVAHYECNNARGDCVDVDEIAGRIGRLLRGERPIPKQPKVAHLLRNGAPKAAAVPLNPGGSRPIIRVVEKTWAFWVDGQRVVGHILVDE